MDAPPSGSGGSPPEPVTAPADETTTTPEDAARGDLIPGWLAALVIVLLVAVVGLGAYVVRDVMTAEPESPETALDLRIEEYETLVEEDPNSIPNRLELGFSYQQAQRYDEAIAQYDAVLMIDERDTAALYNKGIVYIETDRLARAEETLWDVLEIEPTHALAAKQLGEHYASLEQYRSLVEAVRPAAEARPEMADLQYLMGLAYENTGHPDWAAARYRMALETLPDMAEAREGLERLGVEE
jgi:tetratricopeptide (TPR) repeat protein